MRVHERTAGKRLPVRHLAMFAILSPVFLAVEWVVGMALPPSPPTAALLLFLAHAAALNIALLVCAVMVPIRIIQFAQRRFRKPGSMRQSPTGIADDRGLRPEDLEKFSR